MYGSVGWYSDCSYEIRVTVLDTGESNKGLSSITDTAMTVSGVQGLVK